MDSSIRTSGIKVCIRGGGDLASGVAWRLHQCGFKVYITEIPQPLAVRRTVAFCEAVYEGRAEVEGVAAVLAKDVQAVKSVWRNTEIPLLIDPACKSRQVVKPDVLVDAVLAKRNLGTSIKDAPLVIALGPGFTAGSDVHFVVETNRGHNLGRLLRSGCAEPNTGIPGPVMGFTADRVLRAPAAGRWQTEMRIGDTVAKGEVIGAVAGTPVKALIGGVLRGMLRPGIQVRQGLKIGDIDPRGRRQYCYTISEKAMAIAGGALEGILSYFNC